MLQARVDESLQVALGVIYVVLRFLHTFCYVCKIQPFRTVCYALGVRTRCCCCLRVAMCCVAS